MAHRQFYRIWLLILVVSAVQLAAATERAAIDWINRIDSQWGVTRHKQITMKTVGFPVPLGAMNKVRGIWQLERSENVSGQMIRTTWRVDQSPVTDLFDSLKQELSGVGDLQFTCSDRACGNAAEWASRVYGERLLYGRDEYLRYAAFRLPDGAWLTLFSAARTTDRQYLHLDIVVPE